MIRWHFIDVCVRVAENTSQIVLHIVNLNKVCSVVYILEVAWEKEESAVRVSVPGHHRSPITLCTNRNRYSRRRQTGYSGTRMLGRPTLQDKSSQAKRAWDEHIPEIALFRRLVELLHPLYQLNAAQNTTCRPYSFVFRFSSSIPTSVSPYI